MSIARIDPYVQLTESIEKKLAYFLGSLPRGRAGKAVAESFHKHCTGNPQACPQGL
jgi:hypothetical protein